MRGLLLAAVLVVVASCGGGGGSSSPAPVTPTPKPPVDNPAPPPPPPPPPPEPVFELDVVLEADSGDYWEPVRVSIEYTKDGEPVPYEYDVSEGRVVEVEGGLEIYSNGQLGDHTMVIEGEEFQYSFRDMPVCEGTRDGLMVVDCVGLQQGSGSTWYIYYGEEDTRVVDWHVVYVGRVKTASDGLVEPDLRLMEEAESVIEWSNNKLRQSGVYVNLVLKQVIGVGQPNGGFDPSKYPGQIEPSDVLAVSGALPPGVCGYAGQASQFRDRAFALRPLFGCGAMTFLHELGHTVGLGHGDNNGQQPGGGSTFRFAIGSSFCGYRSDIMQYGGSDSEKFFANHKMTCRELTGKDDKFADEMAGSLQSGSTAYAINRVRYDVALVNDEFREAR